MEKLKQAGKDQILEQDIETLHGESRQWLSEIKLWKIELAFFQRLLDHNSQKYTSKEEKMRMSHFQNLIIYYTGEVLDRFKQKIRSHENYLATELAKEGELDSTIYRNKHAETGCHISSFRQEFNMYKREFFDFIEKAI